MAKRFLSPINFNNLSEDPLSASIGDFYFNTTKNRLRYYDGSIWRNVSQFIIESDVAPSNPESGDIWYNTLKLKTYIWYDNYWVEIGNISFSIGSVQEGFPVFISTTQPSTSSEKYIWFKDLENGNYDILIENGSE